MITPACYQYLPGFGYSDLLFIDFGVLTHFQKIYLIIHVYQMGFLCSTLSYKKYKNGHIWYPLVTIF